VAAIGGGVRLAGLSSAGLGWEFDSSLIYRE